jgi:hypothetical protein
MHIKEVKINFGLVKMFCMGAVHLSEGSKIRRVKSPKKVGAWYVVAREGRYIGRPDKVRAEYWIDRWCRESNNG